MAKVYEPPEYNEAVMCPHCGEESDVLTGFYGLIGGGIGPYTICGNCGMVVTKSFEEREGAEIHEAVDDAIEAEFSEVKDERGAIEKDKG